MYTSDKNHLANKEDIFRNKELLEAIKQLKSGDERGFATIYHQTYKYIYSRAKTMFSDEQQVQDLVQEVYVAVYRNIGSLKSDESLYAWLRTITFQQGTKLMRKDRKELLLSEDNEEMFDSILDEDAEVENDLVDRQDIETIRECINKLSSEHKSVILAYYYDNLKVEDIAELLEISVGTVKSRLHSARKKLKEYIEEQEKKQGYKLHSFGGITFILVMESMLQENMSLSAKTIDISFASICKELGIKATPIPKVNIASATKVHKMKSIFTKIAELGTKKAIAVAVGTVAVTGTVGVTGAVLVNENILFHEHVYVEEVTAEPMCETDGMKTFSCECGDSYTEVITAGGHSFETYVSNEDATYLADGTETATCVCGVEDTRVAVGSRLEYTFEDEELTLYAKGNITVRDVPSETGIELGSFSDKQEVKITGRCVETSWYRIIFNEGIGYVENNNLTKTPYRDTDIIKTDKSEIDYERKYYIDYNRDRVVTIQEINDYQARFKDIYEPFTERQIIALQYDMYTIVDYGDGSYGIIVQNYIETEKLIKESEKADTIMRNYLAPMGLEYRGGAGVGLDPERFFNYYTDIQPIYDVNNPDTWLNGNVVWN